MYDENRRDKRPDEDVTAKKTAPEQTAPRIEIKQRLSD
jgi:hypothetical protein